VTLASLGRAMGFLDENLAGFRRRNEICLYAPDHAAVYRPPAPAAAAAAAAAEAATVVASGEALASGTTTSEASVRVSTGLALDGGATPTPTEPRGWRPQQFPRGMELPSLVATVVGDSGAHPR
jgi:hypothetical protein